MPSQFIGFPPDLFKTLKSSHHVVALTGAGISAESGVPTFRQAQTGLWSQYDPTELATPEAFDRNPKLVWEWYTWRRDLISQVQPNPGHFALVELEKYYPKFTLITQNVDGLHKLAGSKSVIELHGDIFRTRCSIEDILIPDWSESSKTPPHCPHCDGLLRPDVVWFGESLPQDALELALEAVRTCQVFLSIGTSTLVEPVASLPFMALNQGAIAVEINPQRTPFSPLANYSFPHPAGQVLPRLIEAIKA